MAHRKNAPAGVVLEHARGRRTACQAAQARPDGKCASCCSGCVLASPIDSVSLPNLPQGVAKLRWVAGAILYHEGEEGTDLYSLRSGLVKLIQHLPNGTHRIVRVLRRGDMVGLELLYRPSYRHMAMALGPVDACRIPASAIAELNRSHPRLHEQLLGCWGRDTEAADWWITRLSTGPVEARLARLIHFLKERDEAHPAHLLSLPHREDLAAMLGVATETICRSLTHLQNDGLLRKVEPGLFEFNADRWEELAAGG